MYRLKFSHMNLAIILHTVFATMVVAALPPNAAYTYQGQLKFNGSPITRDCDMEIYLFDAPSGGNVVAADTLFDVPVVNGLFTVRLDFGLNGFDGSPKYLEFVVVCGDLGPTTLSPRQEITPTPESIYSQKTQGIHIGDSENVGIGTTSPGARLTLSRPIQSANHQLELRNEGSIQIPNFDGIVFTQGIDGGTELGSIKLMYRNTGRPDLSFGVRDRPHALYIHGNESGRGGNVGIGTTTPTSRLEVNGDIKTSGSVIIPPTIRYLMISSADWAPRDSSMVVTRVFANLSSRSAPVGQETVLYAPVHLPDGASVWELRAFINDSVVDGDLSLSFELEHRFDGLRNPFGQLITQGTPGFTEHVTTIQDAIIDNSNFAYFLKLTYTVPPANFEEHFWIRPVRIGYEITSPLP